MFDQAQLFCTTMMVENLEEATALFTSVLGFKTPETGPLKPADSSSHKVKYAFLEKGGRHIELVEPSGGPRLEMFKRRGPGPYLLDFVVSDINAASQHFRDHGFELFDPSGNALEEGKLHKTATGVSCFYAYVAGIYIEVQEPH